MVSAEVQHFSFCNKSQARYALLKKRTGLAVDKEQAYTRQFFENFIILYHSFLTHPPQTVALYKAFKNELPLTLVEGYLFEKHIQLCLPFIEGNAMHFACHTPNAQLQKNCFGIEEPFKKTVLDFSTINLVIVPLVGFDQKGYRIGMGKGFYDRFLSSYSADRHTIFVGVGYEFQKIESCFPDPWDIKLDYVITNQNIYTFK